MRTSNPLARARRTDALRRAQLLAAFDRSGLSGAGLVGGAQILRHLTATRPC